MAKKGEARQRITLKCTECKEENYRTEKNKKNTTDRLELINSVQNVKRILFIKKLNSIKTLVRRGGI